MPADPINRRNFVQAAAAGALALPGARAAGKPRRVALLGSGWYGKNDLFRLVQVEDIEIAALCDPDKHQLEADQNLASTRHKSGAKPKLYTDFREMLKQEELDIVEVATPDHWHAYGAIEAMKAGADVYVQKPVCADVTEGAAMLAAARKYKRVVQGGMQRRSAPHLVDARNRLKEGMLGKISHAEVCCYRHQRAKGNPPDIDPPAHLDYEMWTGPAPMRPYCEWTHPRRWRAFMEYGNGIMGDMCIHMLDIVRWQLDLGWPTEIYSTGGIYHDKASKANIPDTQTATFKFPELDVVWQMRSWGRPVDPKYPWAFFIHGEKGVLKASTREWEFFPVDPAEKPIRQAAITEMWKYDIDHIDMVESRLPKAEFPVLRAHMRDFLKAIDNRSKPIADIEQGFISSAACILGNVSMELGRSLKYDPAKHEVTGDAEATAKLTRPYRKPWVHPTPENV